MLKPAQIPNKLRQVFPSLSCVCFYLIFVICLDLLYEDDGSQRCYPVEGMAAVSGAGAGNEGCRLTCRASKAPLFLYNKGGSSTDCYCLASIPTTVSRKASCDSTDYYLQTTGLGLPLVPVKDPVHPSYATDTTDTDGY